MQLPNFGDEPATLAFHRELYVEHLDAAAFLYEQRRATSDDPELTWLDAGDTEARLEAHIDALSSAGGLAVDICRPLIEESEPGELYTALCVFCRQQRRDLVGEALKRLDPAKAQLARAVSDALRDEMPAEWADALASGISRGFNKLIPTFAQYLGYRRLNPGAVLDSLVQADLPHGLPELIWALGRTGSEHLRSRIAPFTDHPEAVVRSHAIMALLRRGDVAARASCRQRAEMGDSAMYLPLAACGGRAEARLLHDHASASSAPPEVLLALGILGDVSNVRFLLQSLEDPELAGVAASALHLITGAGLSEELFVPDEIHEDELFDEELKAYRETGEVPMHPDGRPFGVTVQRPSQSAEGWHSWLDKHKNHFDPVGRYRLGKPCSPAALVETLAAAAFPRLIRSLAYEELVIRYGIDARFEVDMRVEEQKDQINALSRLGRAHAASVEAGRWYFAGNVV
jgi:uncharacterized protein (TIGR02270 family)